MYKPTSPPLERPHPGQLLKAARMARGHSQLDLALTLGISQRHLSFVETERAQPRRELILAWMDACGASESDRNAALLRSGLAPEPTIADLDAPKYRDVYDALVTILAAHEPFPAFVFDADWHMLRLNRGGQRTCGLTLPEYFAREPFPERGIADMIDCVAAPDGLLGKLRDPQPVATALLAQMRAEQMIRPALRSRVDRLERSVLQRYGGLSAPERAPEYPFLAGVFDTLAGTLSMIAVQTVFALPLNVTGESLRIEFWFPTDEATRRILSDPAAPRTGARMR